MGLCGKQCQKLFMWEIRMWRQFALISGDLEREGVPGSLPSHIPSSPIPPFPPYPFLSEKNINKMHWNNSMRNTINISGLSSIKIEQGAICLNKCQHILNLWTDPDWPMTLPNPTSCIYECSVRRHVVRISVQPWRDIQNSKNYLQ